MRALYRHFSADGGLLYVGTSANPLARTLSHSADSLWLVQTTLISIEWFISDLEANRAEIEAIQSEGPQYNIKHKEISVPSTTVSLDDVPLFGFEKWIKDNGLKKGFVADKLGIGREYLWYILTGRAKPSAALMGKISELTGGDVK